MHRLTLTQACELLRTWSQTLNNHTATFIKSTMDADADMLYLGHIRNDLVEIEGAIKVLEEVLATDPLK